VKVVCASYDVLPRHARLTKRTYDQFLNCGKRNGGSLTSELGAVGVEGEESGECPPSQSTMGSGEHRKLPQRGLGAEPQPKLNSVYFSHKIWLLVTIFHETDDRKWWQKGSKHTV